MQYETDPATIEAKSMAIIEEQLKSHSYNEAELAVVKRMIHTSGDVDYQEIIAIKPGAVQAGIDSIKNGCTIVTDTKMALAGINKKVLAAKACKIDNYVTHESVVELAKSKGITRSMAAIDFAVEQEVEMFVIGNAPTALFRLGELFEAGKTYPKLIIGVPVGFVGAAESKEYIRTLNIPSITTIGKKGGSNIAASVLNALLYQLD
ncbi:MAG: precorrin-8X methylmutase [Proteobacteria bacterium]|nr:precorrin-8X methylmutase [Pseudomonadota bacterium]